MNGIDFWVDYPSISANPFEILVFIGISAGFCLQAEFYLSMHTYQSQNGK